MTTTKSRVPTQGVPSVDAATRHAADALESAGYEAIDVSLPHRTRSTWIVPATTAAGRVRVHIDPRSGATRIVDLDE
ncbi:hypothetical protein Halru_1806 [Halovivax ruber XH-70]|uniref:PepSY domain-containing protein n=1 Tax=Halovivax ruber (strain DSM 18193 / JCM 13892 / XH-70) TaxID=797302 RepID=L0I9Z7_HALRX|nr:hypothetical protein [Halovivax ruber]AGB16405.1 hypothetical protein Halru_1806 [Halovivax ruber XH-70]